MKKVLYALTLLLSASSITALKAHEKLNEKHVKVTAALLYTSKHFGAYFGMKSPSLTQWAAQIPQGEKIHLKDHVEPIATWADIALTKESIKYLLEQVAPQNSIKVYNKSVNTTQAIDPLVEIAFGVGSYCSKNHSATKKDFDVVQASTAAMKTAVREIAVHGIITAGDKTGLTKKIASHIPDWAQSQTARTIYIQALRGGIDAVIKNYAQ